MVVYDYGRALAAAAVAVAVTVAVGDTTQNLQCALSAAVTGCSQVSLARHTSQPIARDGEQATERRMQHR
jgi:hypothetical protein